MITSELQKIMRFVTTKIFIYFQGFKGEKILAPVDSCNMEILLLLKEYLALNTSQ